MVNGKRAYELKGKFLDDLCDNAISGTNREDAVEHTEYFLKIVDPFNFPNVNYERLRLFVFPILLVGNASEWFDEFKERVADEELSDAEEANNDDEQETNKIFRIETNLFDNETPLCVEFKELFTHDIERTKTYKDYENELNDELEEPCNNLDKEEHENEVRCELFDNPHYETPVWKTRRFEMIKYSFGQDEEYVAIKECEYDDLKKTNEDACRAYQEIFRSMDERWMVTREE
nr:hypothetical protein [Tanacetum cinerariifolium]